MTKPSTEEPSVPEAKPPRSKFSIIGWVLGALSLLNLAEDLTPMKIVGKLKVWLEAYATFIETIRFHVLGWIDLAWLRVDETEAHAIVIGAILISAYIRADIRYERAKGESWGTAIGVVLFMGISTLVVLLLVPAILLPGLWGVAGVGVGVLLLSTIYLSKDIPGQVFAGSADIKNEILGVLGAFLLLVALNYSVFS